MGAVTEFDFDDSIKNTIDEKFKELLTLCQMHRIPMYATAAIANSEKGTEYNSIIYNATSYGIILADDKIRLHMLVASGFEVVPPRDIVTFDPLGVLDAKDKKEPTPFQVPENIRSLYIHEAEELLRFCEVYHIPTFLTAVFSNDEIITGYYSIIYNASSHDVVLKDDRIRRHMLVSSGFYAVPPREGPIYHTAEEVASDG